MALFPKTLKLYHFFDKKKVSLSIKVSDSFVITYWMSQNKFGKMINESYEKKGFTEDRYFVQVKKDYVRFSKSVDGLENQLRIENEKWAALIKDYKQKIESSVDDNYFSCEVD